MLHTLKYVKTLEQAGVSRDQADQSAGLPIGARSKARARKRRGQEPELKLMSN
jgi:hypothetical protein